MTHVLDDTSQEWQSERALNVDRFEFVICFS